MGSAGEVRRRRRTRLPGSNQTGRAGNRSAPGKPITRSNLCLHVALPPFPRRELARSSVGTEGSTLPSNTPLVGGYGLVLRDQHLGRASLLSQLVGCPKPRRHLRHRLEYRTAGRNRDKRLPLPGRLNRRQGCRHRARYSLGALVVHGTRNRGAATRVRRDRERKGLLSAPATRPAKGYQVDPLTVILQPLAMQPFATWHPTRAVWGTHQPDLFGR